MIFLLRGSVWLLEDQFFALTRTDFPFASDCRVYQFYRGFLPGYIPFRHYCQEAISRAPLWKLHASVAVFFWFCLPNWVDRCPHCGRSVCLIVFGAGWHRHSVLRSFSVASVFQNGLYRQLRIHTRRGRMQRFPPVPTSGDSVTSSQTVVESNAIATVWIKVGIVYP